MNPPLSGIGILVTRDVRQAADLSERLKSLGAIVFEFPLIEITQPSSQKELDAAIHSISNYDWIIFASTNAVDFCLERMASLAVPLTQLSNCRLAAVGSTTAAQLAQHGLKVTFTPEEFSGEAFVREFREKYNPENQRFLWPRTNIGKLLIKEKLEECGATVDAVTAYETQLPRDAAARAGELIQLIEGGKVQIITLTSSQAARNLRNLLGRGDCRLQDIGEKFILSGRDLAIATIGAETAKTASAFFGCPIVPSKMSTIADLVSCIASYVEQDKRDKRNK